MYFRKSERVVLEELKKYMKRTEEGIRIQMVTKRIRVYGIVQGVGFRPTVSRHAATAGITGSVCNKGPYVEIFAQGEEKCVKDFLERLEKKPPKRAAILKINVEDLKEAGTGERCEENGREKNIPEMDDNKAAENVIKKKIVVYKDFQIIESEKTKGEIFVSRISQSVMNVKKRCMTRKTGGTCIHLSTVPAADRDLQSWMLFHMTGRGPV